MQKNRVKVIFKRSKLTGELFGCRPVLQDSYYLDTFINLFEASDALIYCTKSCRVVVGNRVYEMHTDKHNNLIYREYEKKK